MEIAPQLAEALGRMRHLLAPAGFDPGTERRTFRLGMSDYGAALMLPALLPLIRAQAPHVDLVVSQASREVMAAEVMDGETDLAFGVFPDPDRALRVDRLFEERFACLAGAESLAGRQGMDMATYLTRPHALVALRADSESEVDSALAALGLKRRLCLVLPHWSVAPDLIAGTDLVLTIARRILPSRPEEKGLRIFTPPFDIPPFGFQQIWHRRRDGDPAHQWLRGQIKDLLAA
ncbi:LysR substrate-binding domain-containing protein [Mesorhizobium sp. L-8-10]|uniref:LysR substrate-binding domain-containing protein n=1 Tax=Mesorhizobium sp. L-8-10 TaxID=2744523 RepID=UPI001FD4F0CB|nr:LysR substrate-binding domain-containing protein [Mesorhizobium sp. L-8-10]